MHPYALFLLLVLTLGQSPAQAYNISKGRPLVGNQQAPTVQPKDRPRLAQGRPIVGQGPIYRKPKLVQSRPKPKPKPRPQKKPVAITRKAGKVQTPKPRAKPPKRAVVKPRKRTAAKKRWSPPKRAVRRVVPKPRPQVKRPVAAQRIYVQPKLAPKPPQKQPGAIQRLTQEQERRFIPRSVNQMVQKSEEMLWPLTELVRISSVFGWRVHPISKERRFHAGTDLAAPKGTPVVAAYSGQVITAARNGGYGLSILLNHQGGSFRTRYAHLSALVVQPDVFVHQGQVIGEVGSTGRSTGPHLHIELLQRQADGSFQTVDPGPLLNVAKVRLTQARHLAKQRRGQ